jgi:cytochrome c55X
MRLLIAVFGLLCTALAHGPVSGQSSGSPATVPGQSATLLANFEPSQIDQGKRLYTSFCARCHGLNMVSTAAGFYDLRTFPADDRARFTNSVTNGIRAMPAWGSSFKPEEIDTLWAYVIGSRKK